jgi:hypothetical protein
VVARLFNLRPRVHKPAGRKSAQRLGWYWGWSLVLLTVTQRLHEKLNSITWRRRYVLRAGGEGSEVWCRRIDGGPLGTFTCLSPRLSHVSVSPASRLTFIVCIYGPCVGQQMHTMNVSREPAKAGRATLRLSVWLRSRWVFPTCVVFGQ